MSRASVREALEIVEHTGPHATGDRIAHLRNLRSDRYRLKDDLVISISEEDNGFVARSFDLGQYGCGPSTDDAIDHLCSVVEAGKNMTKQEAHQALSGYNNLCAPLALAGGLAVRRGSATR